VSQPFLDQDFGCQPLELGYEPAVIHVHYAPPTLLHSTQISPTFKRIMGRYFGRNGLRKREAGFSLLISSSFAWRSARSLVVPSNQESPS